MIVAIVPAAGKSERMGRPKLLLPLGPRRVIQHVLHALTGSEVDQTVVVLPPAADELRLVVSDFSVEIMQLSEPTPDMRTSILHGLDHAESMYGPDQLEAFLIALADQPTLSSQTINHLVEHFHSSRGTIIIPTHGGKRGHPALFSWEHAAGIRAIPPHYGLNHLVAEHADEVEEFPLNDPNLLEDLDTPDDFKRLQNRP